MAQKTANDGTRLIRALRLRQQGLVPGATGWASPAEVTRGMLSMQGQDFGGVKHALALRCGPGRPDEVAVDEAFSTGEVVRNRPSRGTLQVTAPEDLHWLTGLLSVRSNAAGKARRGDLGITQAMVDGIEAELRTVLGGGQVVSRTELRSRFAEAGLPDDSARVSHILRHLTETMAIVYGPPAGKTETFVLADDWLGDRRELEGDAALAEAATRYFSARGPATIKDFAWWSNLTMGDVRKAVARAGAALEHVEIDGAVYVAAAGATHLTEAEIDQALADPLLLPSFDEYLLGYTERGAVLDPDHFSQIVPGRNGMFRAVVVVGGEVVGTWQRSMTKKQVSIEIHPFGRLGTATKAGLEQRAEEVGTFLGRVAGCSYGT